MISGRQALASVEQAIGDVRSKENGLDGALASAMAEADRLRHALVEGFRSLARIRLDALQRDEVVGRLDASEQRVLDGLARRREALAAIANQRSQSAAEVARLQAIRHDRATEVERIVAEIDRLSAATEARVKAAPEWQAAAAQVDQAKVMADAADKKAEQAEQDRAVKGAPYEADKLFMYLWRRGFGTSTYQAGSFARFFDRKVAQLIGYDAARPNYATLTAIPVRLREHAKKQRAEIEAVQARLAAAERKSLVADGVEAIEARLAQARHADDAAAADLAAEQSRLAELDKQHEAGLSATGDDEALGQLAERFAQSDLATLYAQAQATPTPDDETIVQRIGEIQAAIQRVDAQINDIRTEAREVARRRSELEQSRDQFRQSGYDHPHATFDNENLIGQVLGGIVGGVLSSPDLWRVLQGGLRMPQSGSGPVFGGGSSFPMPGPRFPMPGSGGHSGGGNDDGSFKTGGGF